MHNRNKVLSLDMLQDRFVFYTVYFATLYLLNGKVLMLMSKLKLNPPNTGLSLINYDFN